MTTSKRTKSLSLTTSKDTRLANLFPFGLVLPAVVILALVQIYPTLYSLYLSTTRMRAGKLTSVGIKNFERLLASSDFFESLQRTVVFAGSYLILTVVLGLILALLLNRRSALTPVYLVMVFIPWVLSDVVSGTIWRWMFNQSYGLIQVALNPLLDNKSILSNNDTAMMVVIAASVWRTLAFTALLFLGALQTIPGEVLEAAALDGANRWQSFWRVTFPMMRPTLLVVILITSIRGINSLGLILSTTSGGPGAGTTTAAVYLYRTAWQFGDFGVAAAMAVFLFIVNLILTIFYLRVVRVENNL